MARRSATASSESGAPQRGHTRLRGSRGARASASSIGRRVWFARPWRTRGMIRRSRLGTPFSTRLLEPPPRDFWVRRTSG